MKNNRIHVNIYVYGTSMIGFLYTRTHFLTLMHTFEFIFPAENGEISFVKKKTYQLGNINSNFVRKKNIYTWHI